MMALIYLPHVLKTGGIRTGFHLSKIPKFVRIQSASMTSKENRDPSIIKPEPWPYKTKKFTFNRGFFEGTVKRFDENTKVVVVDGNIGAGKSAFAKQLAEAFDFEYFPEPTMEPYFVSTYGFDLRKIDELLPPSYKCCDVSTFYANPYHQNVAKFQFRMYMFRLEQYLNALAHILNTGQGVVLERCVYGDFVFAEAMYKHGYLSAPVMDLYYDMKINTLEELMRPHLIIYLDISPEVALERIKKRNDPTEVNSKVLTKEYLATIEYLYKQKYLKEMEKHAELMIYDWSNFGDMEVVVEDIERIDFERFTEYETKMSDWRKEDDYEWNYYRRFYTNKKPNIMRYGVIYRPWVDELFHPGEEAEQFQDILLQIPGERYAEGFNPAAGDSVLFKTNPKSYFKTMWARTFHPVPK